MITPNIGFNVETQILSDTTWFNLHTHSQKRDIDVAFRNLFALKRFFIPVATIKLTKSFVTPVNLIVKHIP